VNLPAGKQEIDLKSRTRAKAGVIAGLIFHGLPFSGRMNLPARKREIDLKSQTRDEI